jgi:hypothetical protein
VRAALDVDPLDERLQERLYLPAVAVADDRRRLGRQFRQILLSRRRRFFRDGRLQFGPSLLENAATSDELIDTLLAGGGREGAGFEGVEIALERTVDLLRLAVELR